MLVRNTGNTIIDSLDIAYFVWNNDSIGIPEQGPPTYWVNPINPGEEVIINLTKWDTINVNSPLVDGTYLLLVKLFPRLIPPNPNKTMERTFILEQ